jgi:MFS family permease
MKGIIIDFAIAFKKSTLSVKLALLAVLLISTAQSAYMTIFNLYLSAGGLNNSAIGGILFMSGIGASIFAFPAGILGDRFGRKKFLILSSVLIPLVILIQAVTMNSTVLAIFSLFYGVMILVLRITMNPFLAENAEKHERVHLFALLFVVTNIGGVIGSYFSGQISTFFKTTEFLSLRYTLIIFAVLSLFSLFLVLPISEDKWKKRTEVLYQKLTSDFSNSFKFAVQTALIGLGAGAIVPFLNLYFKDYFHLTPDPIGIIFSVSSLFFLIFGLFGPRISKRIGILKGALLYELLSIPFLIVLGNRPPLVLAVMSFWFRGGLMNAGTPLLSTIQMDLISEGRRGTVSGFLTIVDNLSRAFGTLFGGFLLDKYGFGLNFYLTAVLYSISIVYFYMAYRNNRRLSRITSDVPERT